MIINVDAITVCTCGGNLTLTTAPGKTIYTCTQCGDTATDEIKPARWGTPE